MLSSVEIVFVCGFGCENLIETVSDLEQIVFITNLRGSVLNKFYIVNPIHSSCVRIYCVVVYDIL